MGRRSVSSMSPEEVRSLVSKNFRRLVNTTGVNLAQYEAQIHEADAVRMLWAWANDAEQAVGFRRDCVKDVLLYARGGIKTWEHAGETINPSMLGQSGRPVGEEINAVRLMSDVMQELNDLVARKVPFAAWPPHVVEAAGASVTYYREDLIEPSVEGEGS